MKPEDETRIQRAYKEAEARYAELGVDTEEALRLLSNVHLSFPCWQLDDVNGFERTGSHNGGGTVVTGSYPGKARNATEMRLDAEQVFAAVPGSHRLNIHAIYLEAKEDVPRDQIAPEHFKGWIEWAQQKKLGLDFNPTFFDHPKAAEGFTLSHYDDAKREFWIRHGIASRKIAQAMGQATGSPCVVNTWIPDGFKDAPANRKAFRARLHQSLDQMFAEPLNPLYAKDAVESKLFGIGAESCTVGSHEFYLSYALLKHKMLCLDMGHFHPTEQIGDKISAILEFTDELLLHVSRPVRWDSDHVVIQDGEMELLAAEVVRGGFLPRVNLALDFFDGTINRVAALVIGGRAVLRSFCRAALEPAAELSRREQNGEYTWRLAMQEELKAMPWQAVWDWYCLKNGAPVGSSWLKPVLAYESRILEQRK